MTHREEMLAQLEAVMAKGQKRSNRESKKPKKTAAERAKATTATTALGGPGMAARDGARKGK